MRGWLNKLLGNQGERIASRYLRGQGFRILSRQHRNKLGEVDLIALDGNCVVFVEVKTRSSLQKGHPAEAVTGTKQRQLTQVALAFLKARKLLEHPARFDVVAIVLPDKSDKPEIEHYRNAFEAQGFGQFFC